MHKQLTELPVSIDAEAIARGLLELFTEDERVILRFGMLPAEKMRILENEFESHFRSMSTSPECKGDELIAITNIPGRRHIEFSMKKLVAEAVRMVCLELYAIGDLVV